jgi:hypothetical protein
VIEVSDWLIEPTEALRIQLGGPVIPCRRGKQLGSLYLGAESPGLSVDYLPNALLDKASNLADFARVLVLDKWTCNSDGRQAIFCLKTARSRRYPMENPVASALSWRALPRRRASGEKLSPAPAIRCQQSLHLYSRTCRGLSSRIFLAADS